jgi:hypothetical protein
LNKIISLSFSVKQLKLVGESCRSLLVSLDKDKTNILLSTQQIKVFIYHYFEAAELTADNTSLRLALAIGESFKLANKN